MIFHGSKCKICDDYFEKIEEIAKIIESKYDLPLAFGRMNFLSNDPPFKITKNPEFYIFPKENVRNLIKIGVPKNFDHMMSFILNNIPFLRDKDLNSFLKEID